MMIDKLKKAMTPFQWAEILAVTVFTVYFAAIDHETPLLYNLLSALAAICGIFCVVLCAAGKKSQYYWGFVNIVAYIAVAWVNRFWGEVMLNGLYYLPSQFIGIYLWKKHYNDADAEVESKRMKPVPTAVLIAATAVGIVLYRWVLMKLGGNSAWLDSASTVISVAANALMLLRYREQWTLWVIVDAVTVVMWARGGDPIMTTMWAVYLINAVYGYVNWTRLSNKVQAAA